MDGWTLVANLDRDCRIFCVGGGGGGDDVVTVGLLRLLLTLLLAGTDAAWWYWCWRWRYWCWRHSTPKNYPGVEDTPESDPVLPRRAW